MLGFSGGIWGHMGLKHMLFTGSYRRAIDDKLRLAVPQPLRSRLPVETPLYLTPGQDGCLAAYPEAAFAVLAERLASHSPAAREVRDYSRLFYSQATCAALDKHWRFRVPVELSKWAGLDGEVMIVGVRDHLEVWAIDRWNEYVARCDANYDQLAERAFATVVAPCGVSATPSVTTSSSPPLPPQPR